MKARVSIMSIAILFSVISVFASTPISKMYSNIDSTELKVVKDFTFFDEVMNKAVKKHSYVYDNSGNMQEKVVYKWSDSKGWIEVQKYNYEYIDGSLVAISYTERAGDKQQVQLVDPYYSDNLLSQK